MTMIRAKRLMTFSVATDSSSVAIGLADEEVRDFYRRFYRIELDDDQFEALSQ